MKRKEVDAINPCFTQEMRIDYSTRDPSFSAHCGSLPGFGHPILGPSLVMETYRALDLPQSVQKHLPLLQRPGKYEKADYVESFLSLFAAGGDCWDDFHFLRQDVALQKLGRKVPSPEAARFFLNAFHEEEALGERVAHQAFIPVETEFPEGLAGVNRDLIGKATRQQGP